MARTNPGPKPKTNPGPTPDQPRTNPGPTPDQPRTNPRPTPDQPRTNPGPTPEQPRTFRAGRAGARHPGLLRGCLAVVPQKHARRRLLSSRCHCLPSGLSSWIRHMSESAAHRFILQRRGFEETQGHPAQPRTHPSCTVIRALRMGWQYLPPPQRSPQAF